MCRRACKPNYYIAMGMLLSTGTYFLYEYHWISHEMRFISLVIAIVLMFYGIMITKKSRRN